jgi:glyoxylase-like metal-dependent hydrolase (beta-lactamase superfamily II)
MNNKTLLYQITETSKFMMGFVIVTKENNAIVIDGGREEDMPLLKKYIGGRHISAWILTHPHYDHINGFITEFKKNKLEDFDVEKVYYNFPPYEKLIGRTDVPDPVYFNADLKDLGEFTEIEPEFADIAHIVKQGESITVDECKIDFIYTYHEGLVSNLINDSSLAFALTTPNTRIMFLGDLGPEGGDVLYEESRHLLKADIVQMAHHGHMNVGMEVYAAIMPKACLWCCADWLYEEDEIPDYLEDRATLRAHQRERMYGTKITRQWMDILGVEQHYVTKDGTNIIEI